MSHAPDPGALSPDSSCPPRLKHIPRRLLVHLTGLSDRTIRDIQDGRRRPSYVTAQRIAWAINPRLTAEDLFSQPLAGAISYQTGDARLVLRIAFLTRRHIGAVLAPAGISRHRFAAIAAGAALTAEERDALHRVNQITDSETAWLR